MNPVVGITKVVSRIGKSVMKCRPIAKAVVKVNKNKPEILAVGGGICIATAFGLAIYEAVTVKDSLNESVEKVKTVTENRDAALEKDDISEEEKNTIIKTSNSELMRARVDGVLVVVKKFAVPTTLLVVGMKMGHDGFKILRARNILLGGALKSTEDLLKFYRENVRADLGKEADLKYMRGVVGEQQVEEVKKDENGKEKKVMTTLPVVKDNDNPWRFKFDDENFNSCQGDTDLDLFFLKLSEDWWNHEYNRNDSITMYEVLKYLGYRFDKAKARMSKKDWVKFMDFVRNYGWWKGSNGDGFVDFGIYRAINEAAVRRMSDVIYIEFNCDGCLQNM